MVLILKTAFTFLRFRPLSIFIAIFFLSSCNKETKPQEKSYPITIATAEEKDVPVYIEAIGNVYSLQIVQIRPQVEGIVEKAFVVQGQYVKTGDPLYKIDPRLYEAALNKAKANLAKDEATLKYSEAQVARNSELVKKDYVSKLSYEQFVSQVDLNKAQVESDKADIARAALNLEWTTIVSPIDGKISQFNIDPGNLVFPNDATALTDVRQMTPADIRFNLSQGQFIEVQKAIQSGELKFEVFLPQEPQRGRKGDIYFIDNHVDPSTGTILFRGSVPNEDELFWPGEFVNVRLLLRDEPKAIVVPSESVKIGQQGPYVYIYRSDTSTVEYRKVKKGEIIDGQTVIREGIKVGEAVVVKGQNNLMPNSKAHVIYNKDEADRLEKATKALP